MKHGEHLAIVEFGCNSQSFVLRRVPAEKPTYTWVAVPSNTPTQRLFPDRRSAREYLTQLSADYGAIASFYGF